jgi:hypothetical protein
MRREGRGRGGASEDKRLRAACSPTSGVRTISKRGIRPRPSREGRNGEGRRKRMTRRGKRRGGGIASNAARRRTEGEDLSSAEKHWERRTQSPGREGRGPRHNAMGGEDRPWRNKAAALLQRVGSQGLRGGRCCISLTSRVVCGGRWRENE